MWALGLQLQDDATRQHSLTIEIGDELPPPWGRIIKEPCKLLRRCASSILASGQLQHLQLKMLLRIEDAAAAAALDGTDMLAIFWASRSALPATHLSCSLVVPTPRLSSSMSSAMDGETSAYCSAKPCTLQGYHCVSTWSLHCYPSAELSWSSGEAPLCTLALPHHFLGVNVNSCARHVTNNPAKDDKNPNETWDDVILSG